MITPLRSKVNASVVDGRVLAYEILSHVSWCISSFLGSQKVAKRHFHLTLPALMTGNDEGRTDCWQTRQQLFILWLLQDCEKWLMNELDDRKMCFKRPERRPYGQVRPLLVPHTLQGNLEKNLLNWVSVFVIFWGFVCFWSTAVSNAAKSSSGSCRKHWGMCQKRARNNTEVERIYTLSLLTRLPLWTSKHRL